MATSDGSPDSATMRQASVVDPAKRVARPCSRTNRWQCSIALGCDTATRRSSPASVRTRKASRRSDTTTSSEMYTFEVSKISRSSTAVCSPSNESSTGSSPTHPGVCSTVSRISTTVAIESTSLGAIVDSCAMASADSGRSDARWISTGDCKGANLFARAAPRPAVGRPRPGRGGPGRSRRRGRPSR